MFSNLLKLDQNWILRNPNPWHPGSPLPTFFYCISTRHDYCSDFLNFSTRCFLRFSLKTMSTWSPNDSFGFCSSRGFQNTLYMLNLINFWMRYFRFLVVGNHLDEKNPKLSLGVQFDYIFMEKHRKHFVAILEITAILMPTWETLEESWLWVVLVPQWYFC